MAPEIKRGFSIEDAMMDERVLSEISEISVSEIDVTWTATAVTIVLRSPKEIARAAQLGLQVVGSTLTILRADRTGRQVHSDDTIRGYIRSIKHN